MEKMLAVKPAEENTKFTASLDTGTQDMVKYLYRLLSGFGELHWQLSEASERYKSMIN